MKASDKLTAMIALAAILSAAGCCKNTNDPPLMHEIFAQDLSDAANRSASKDFAAFTRLREPPFFYATTEFNFFVPGVGYRPQIEDGDDVLTLPVRPLFQESGPINPEEDDRALEYIKDFNALMTEYVRRRIK